MSSPDLTILSHSMPHIPWNQIKSGTQNDPPDFFPNPDLLPGVQAPQPCHRTQEARPHPAIYFKGCLMVPDVELTLMHACNEFYRNNGHLPKVVWVGQRIWDWFNEQTPALTRLDSGDRGPDPEPSLSYKSFRMRLDPDLDPGDFEFE